MSAVADIGNSSLIVVFKKSGDRSHHANARIGMATTTKMMRTGFLVRRLTIDLPVPMDDLH